MRKFRTIWMGLLGCVAGAGAAWAMKDGEQAGGHSSAAAVYDRVSPRSRPVAESATARPRTPARESVEGLAAFVKRANRTGVDCGEIFEDNAGNLFLGNECKVDDRSLKAAGADPSKKEAIQKIIDTGISRTMAEMAKRLKPDPRNSRPEKGVAAYRVTPDTDGGNELLRGMQDEIAELTGEEAARKLSRALVSTGPLASFGRQGVTLLVEKDPAGEGKITRFRYFDPMTGGENTMGQVTMKGPNRDLLSRFVEENLPH